MLALRGRRRVESVVRTGEDDDLGVEPAKRRRQRDDVDHRRVGIQDPLCSHQHGRVTEAILPTFRCAQLEVDDVLVELMPDEPEAVGLLALMLLAGYKPLHAARADLLSRTGHHHDALAAYDRAIGLTDNPTERAFLEAQGERHQE